MILGEGCCSNTNRANCQDYDRVYAGEDLQVAVFANAHIPICGGNALYSPNCGVYIEIHRKNDYVVISDTHLKVEYPNGFQTIFIPTHTVFFSTKKK